MPTIEQQVADKIVDCARYSALPTVSAVRYAKQIVDLVREHDTPVVLSLCEASHVHLKPDTLYRFEVVRIARQKRILLMGILNSKKEN